MQRLAGDFLVKRSAVVYGQGGATTELFELPNGQWQFGKGRDAVVVTSIDQVAGVEDPEIKKAVGAWLERTKGQPKEAVQQGQTPVLAGHTVRDQLTQVVSNLSDENCARLLNAITQTLGPIADSLKQPAPVNHHSDGFGQDQGMHAPGSTEPEPFTLPEGAKWADPTNPATGYLLPVHGVKDDKGHQVWGWHPTPAFNQFVDTAKDDKSDIEREMEAERAKQEQKNGELVGAGSGRTRQAAKPAARSRR